MDTRDWTAHLAGDRPATTGTAERTMNRAQVTCTSGHLNSPGARFCSACGARLVPLVEHERPTATAGAVSPPTRSEWEHMPPPPPRSFHADAQPPRSPGADAPAGLFNRMAAYWAQSSPRRRLVIGLVAAVLIAAAAYWRIGGGTGYSRVDQSAFLSACGNYYPQSVCGCVLANLEQAMPPSLFHEAVTGPTAYKRYFVYAYRSCGVNI
jgi:hypothetical protein